ncbi:glycosyltransferase family 4 protein [Shimia aestuarii]|uniref:Glycosyltransferase involved in cell wall bisynthesis n=1 Tax=Shimia aestuarii TaxID=254406 RepID=A0A1I4Q4H0_9RHOB|nr:glycosyltransferase [Shimia aestuarii]SFM34555.1 Glycosyltransferase involved in cell wall bisynthesis [Shimia aestuarii]
MPTVLHLIPYDTVGGVETAARSVPATWDGAAGPVRYRRGYLVTHSPVDVFPDDWHGAAVSVNRPDAHWKLLRFALESRPDLVVASLWRSCPTLIALKFLRPRTKYVLFLHSAVDVHVFDKVLNRVAMFIADEIWADSETTLAARVPSKVRERAKVLSFLTQRPPYLPNAREKDPERPIAPNFVYWGRLQSEKNLGLALEVFAAVHQLLPDSKFDIFGPDRGSLDELQEQVAELKLGDAVRFLGAVPQEDLLTNACGYSFYLQTSLFEGMAMSVIEAMAMGLVPVVTPVGEIPSYCHDGHTGIHVTTSGETAQRIVELISQPGSWREMSSRAADRWAEARLFQDDYRDACDNLLSRNQAGGGT